MKRHDQVLGAVLFFVSVYFMLEAQKLPWMAQKSPGAGWLPFWLGLLMAILSAVLFVGAVRRPVSTNGVVTWPSGRGLVNNAAILGGLVLLVVALETVGYALSTFGFLLVLLWVLGRYRWWVCTGVSVLVTAILYWVFKVWLVIPLPVGLLKFLE